MRESPCQTMEDFSRRRHARFQAKQEIRVCAFRRDREENDTAKMVDVSQAGMCFVGGRYLSPETKVQIEFEGCVLRGEVRHCRLREYGSGVEFVTGIRVDEVLRGEEIWRALSQSG